MLWMNIKCNFFFNVREKMQLRTKPKKLVIKYIHGKLKIVNERFTQDLTRDQIKI